MKPDRIVFLDIDGVLCTRKAAGWSRNGQPIIKGILRRRPARALDGNAVQRLNTLCVTGSAVVVVTSTWRLDRDVPSILRRAGFSGRFHADWCTDAHGPTRADEITRWLAAHGTDRFIVLDDKLRGLEPFRDSLVLVDNYHGLELCDLDRAAQLLEGH